MDQNNLDTFTHSITGSTFTSNRAGKKGGAIYYTAHPPTMTTTTFTSNVAIYGNNTASYAARVLPISTPLPRSLQATTPNIFYSKKDFASG